MNSSRELTAIGTWTPEQDPPVFCGSDLVRVLAQVRRPVHVVQQRQGGRVGLALEGQRSNTISDEAEHLLLASLAALYPEWLGDRAFGQAHGVRFPYVAGAMANGIATAQLVVALAREHLLGFFGAGGLSLAEIETGLKTIEQQLGDSGGAWGSNLIHSPSEPHLEQQTAELYIQRGVRRVSASAYMSLTPPVVQYACTGLGADGDGRVTRRHHLFAKISRPEVARLFMSPPPEAMLNNLVQAGKLTRQEAALAARVPLAGDVTVEGDSGGHTDNRPLSALMPTILALRQEVAQHLPAAQEIRVGAAGGLGTPTALAAAFGLGAAYVLTGTVNQAAVESGLSAEGKQMLAQAGIADVTMAPSPDMFELGVKVQVLKRGTLFASRAGLLADVYQGHESLEQLPEALRARLEKELFKAPLEQIWEHTRDFFQQRDPRQLELADKDAKHRMALVFRWYLGKSSRWAIAGEPDRRLDYQIWCGPAMGAFNAWTRGSFLATPEQRGVVQIARNLLEGAAVATRAQQLRTYGVEVPPQAFSFQPRPLC